jgi:hypothetical protein
MVSLADQATKHNTLIERDCLITLLGPAIISGEIRLASKPLILLNCRFGKAHETSSLPDDIEFASMPVQETNDAVPHRRKCGRVTHREVLIRWT